MRATFFVCLVSLLSACTTSVNGIGNGDGGVARGPNDDAGAAPPSGGSEVDDGGAGEPPATAKCNVDPGAPGVDAPVIIGENARFDISSAAFDSEGRALVAGRFSVPMTTQDPWPFVARIDATGALDKSFGTQGIARFDWGGLNNDAVPLAVDAQGRATIVLREADPRYPERGESMAVRFTDKGWLDSSFGTGGVVSHLNIPNEINFHGAAVAAVGDDVFVFKRIEPFEMTADDALLGFRITKGALDSTYAARFPVSRRSVWGVRMAATAHGFYVATADDIRRFDAKGAPDYGFGTGGKASISTYQIGAVADGSLAYGALDRFGVISAKGAGVSTSDSWGDVARAVGVRCDGVLVGVARLTDQSLAARKLLPQLDAEVAYRPATGDNDPSTMSSVAAFDPASGRVALFVPLIHSNRLAHIRIRP